MMLFSLFLADPIKVVPMLPVLPELTPAARTKPILQFDCRMIGEEGESSRLVWRKEGQQGYYSKPIEGLKSRPVSITGATFKVVEDEAGLLSSMKFVGFGNLRRTGPTFRDESGNSAVFSWDYDSARKSRKSALSFYLYKKEAIEPQVFSGPCTVTEISQPPLDHDPEKNYQ